MEEYKRALFGEESIHKSAMSIRSKNKVLHTMYVRKLAFSSFDDKRYLNDNKIDTQALFHYKNRLN